MSKEHNDKSKGDSHKVVRVQGGDDDLVAALDKETKNGWRVLNITSPQSSTSSNAGNYWVVVFSKD